MITQEQIKVNTLVTHIKLKSVGIGCVAKVLRKTLKVNFGTDDVMSCTPKMLSVVDTNHCKTVSFHEYRSRILSDKSKLDYCIVGNELQHFVGIGWITIRVVTLDDLKKISAGNRLMVIFVEPRLHNMKHKNKPHMNIRYEKTCIVCEQQFMGTIVQVTCSKECRKIRNNQSMQKFLREHPKAMQHYNETRKKKNPNVWKEKWNSDREEIIAALGGKCIVCPVSNISWLHIDYVPTMIGTGLRHPRHKRWVMDHLKDFRLICANHHYELTLTGKIEGTTITQKTQYDKSATDYSHNTKTQGH
jgi:hypothetical protein